MMTVKAMVTVNDPNDHDELSVKISNSVTGFTLTKVHQLERMEEIGAYFAVVEGTINHLDGFESLADLKKFVI
jgi:hypothetical protein